MMLNSYQNRIVGEFADWYTNLIKERKNAEDVRYRLSGSATDVEIREMQKSILNYPKKAWHGEEYVDRFGPDGRSVPHVCLKVPTGGGKTRMAAATIRSIQKRRGLVLWMVPSKAIRDQTVATLKDKSSPIRRMLDDASGNRVVIKYRTDGDKKPVSLSSADVEDGLCIMVVMMQSANSRDLDSRLMHRSSEQYGNFIPSDEPKLRGLGADHPYLEMDNGIPRSSQANVFRLLKPVIILDEAHKAKAGKFPEWAKFVSDLAPEFVLELSATPNPKQSNILGVATTADLIDESMIKRRIDLRPSHLDWKGTLLSAVNDLKRLDKRVKEQYIRPIMVVRAKYTGADQRGKGIHSEDVRGFLTGELGIPSDQVAVKSSETDELKGVDLMSPVSQIRYIITKDALKEGWDCPFAYMLVVLDRMNSSTSITQQLGRVMRQPYARYTGVDGLDSCYVHYMAERDDEDSIRQTAEQLMSGLAREGFDMHGRIGLDVDKRDTGIVTRRRSPRTAGVKICLPKVSHRDGDGWTDLDYHRHILSEVDWSRISVPYRGDATLDDAKRRVVSSIDVKDGKAVLVREEIPGEPPRLIEWAGAVPVPNPWQGARVVQEFWDSPGLDADVVAANEMVLLGLLCDGLERRVSDAAEKIFKDKLKRGIIRFSLEAPSSAFHLAEEYEVTANGMTQLSRDDGHPFQTNLFSPVLSEEYNSDERNFARYLDEAEAVRWWHRVAARNKRDYHLKGWQKDRIYPDFVALFDGGENRTVLRIYEIKGRQLDNDDTRYKRNVFAALEESFNAGMMKVRGGGMRGEFQIVFDDEIEARKPKTGKPSGRNGALTQDC